MSVMAEQTAGPATAVWLGGAAAAALGLVLAATGGSPAGLDPLEVEDVVDAAGILLVAAVGLPLASDARRRWLALVLAALAAVLGTGLLLDGLGRAVHDGAPEVGNALLVLGSALLPALVVLVAVVLPVLAPEGRPLRPLAGRAASLALVGAALLVVADVLQAGPVDEDAAALGTNPLGVEALDGVLDVARLLALPGVALGLVAAVVSVIVRLTRRGAATRARTAWLAAGVALLVLALALDGELQARGGAAYGVAAAAIALVGLAYCLRRATAPGPDQP